MKVSLRHFWVMTFSILLSACGNPDQRLDEYVFYDGPQIKLKVVRYYRNIPFNYLGEHAIVMCQSENTRESISYSEEDSGWRTLGAKDVQGSRNAKEAALRVKDDYAVLDDQTLIGKINVFNISFDACGHFTHWDPSRLPQAMIDPAEKPDSCAPNGPADCRYHDFEGKRAPQYEQIRVAGKGQVSFTVASPAFKGVERLHVTTRNNGAVWHVETAGTGKADSLQSLPMPLLENGVDDISLMDWLESVLPSRSMVIWPDALGACGDRHASDKKAAASGRCAEIRFNDAEGNSGSLYIAMNTDTENRLEQASFHSGVYLSGDVSRPVASLAGLRESLPTGTR